jgi:hypothetical protein
MSTNWTISKSNSFFLLDNQFSIPSFKNWNTTPWVWLISLSLLLGWSIFGHCFIVVHLIILELNPLQNGLYLFWILSIHLGDGRTFLGQLYHMSTNFLQNLTTLICLRSSQTIFNFFLNKCIIIKITSHVIFTLLCFHLILSSSTSLKPKRKSPCDFTKINLQVSFISLPYPPKLPTQYHPPLTIFLPSTWAWFWGLTRVICGFGHNYLLFLLHFCFVFCFFGLFSSVWATFVLQVVLSP